MSSSYEPYIFAALNSAKVMVVLGTKPEFFHAVWVKNEWSRYLALIKQGQKKMLIPAYKDMDLYDFQFKHYRLLHRIGSYIVSTVTSTSIIHLVIGTDKIMNILVYRVHVAEQFFVEIPTVKQIAKDTLFSVLRFGCSAFFWILTTVFGEQKALYDT